MRHPAMYVPVEIVEGVNDRVIVHEGVSEIEYVTVASGSYADVHSLATAFVDAAGATPGLPAFAVSLARNGKTLGVSHAGSSEVWVHWHWDSRSRGLATILGFDPESVSGVQPGQWTYGTRSPQGWWTSDMPVAVDEGDMPDEEEVQTRALSGYRQTSILSPVRRVREVRIDLLLARHMWTRAEVLPGESFETAIWPHRHHVRYFSDRNDPSTGADYVITEPQGRLRPARYQGREDVARYVLSLEMERLVGGGA